MYRKLYHLMLFLVIAAMLAACAPTPTAKPVQPTPQPAAPTAETQPTKPAAESDTTGSTAEVKTYPVTVYQVHPWVRESLPEKREDDFLRTFIYENYGIDLKIQYGPAEDAISKLNAMIASGEIPEMIQVYSTVSDSSVRQWIDQGVLVPVDDYLEKYPSLKNLLPDPLDWRYLQYEGKTWGVAPAGDGQFNILWARKDWLDKLGLKAPTTIEELEAVAKAFTTQDPDGNGRNDTFGFTSGKEGDGVFGYLQSVFAPFGAMPGRNHFRIENNEVILDALSPQALDALKWWNRMIEAGYVSPDWVSNTSEQVRESLIQGRVGLVTGQFQMTNTGYDSETTFGNAIKAANPDAEWVIVRGLQGPYGRYTEWRGNSLSNTFFLTRSADSEPGKMDAIMRFLSEVMDETSKTYRLVNFGPKDVVHTTDAEGSITSIDWTKMPQWTISYELWRAPNQEWWYWAIMGGNKDQFYLWDNYEITRNEPQIDHVTELVASHDASADFSTYVAEMHIKFALGDEPFENWDKFVQKAMTTYRGQDIKDDAEQQLRVLGILK